MSAKTGPGWTCFICSIKKGPYPSHGEANAGYIEHKIECHGFRARDGWREIALAETDPSMSADPWLKWLEENGKHWDTHSLPAERMRDLEAQVAALREALELQASTHDQGHSPCFCIEARAALALSRSDDGGGA